MNITCERPYAFLFLVLLIPALAVSIYQHKKVSEKITFFSVAGENGFHQKRMRRLPLIMSLRLVFRTLCWIMLVFAFAGISWGTYLEPSNKNGSSVAMVFDISYSMMAKDAQGGQTRLKAGSEYASMLLSHAEESSVSVVLAKGDGVTLIPLTEDKAIVESLLDSLSPSLMTSGGTSLGKGVRAALKSFPKNSSRLSSVWLFTDGEETDGLLENAVSECLKNGVSVCIIGFGRENETKVLAGDGKTEVHTALRKEKMKKICLSASEKAFPLGSSYVRAEFVDSSESGSALKVLSFLKGQKANPNDEQGEFVTYEVRPVQRYSLFLVLALLFMVLSFIVSELDAEGISEKARRKKKGKPDKSALFIMLSVPVLFSSCSLRFEGAKTVLESTWNWYQKKYSNATAGYLKTLLSAEENGDELLSQHAIYNLGTTYLMQNENEAALERFSQISDDAPDKVKYAAFYNTGIIAYRQGDYDSAIQCFRSALKIDGTKINAKINLELSEMKNEKDSKTRENAILPVSESEGKRTMEDNVFRRIRENDMKQWKSVGNTNNVSGAEDF